MKLLLDVVGRLLRLAVALVLVAMGLVFFISLLLAGAVATGVWAVWCLLTGRKPTFVRFGAQHVDPRAAWARFYGDAAASGPGTPAQRAARDAIDVDARDVKER